MDICLGETITKKERVDKGKSCIAFPQDFTVIDTETTGLEPQFDEIIEIAAMRVRDGKVVATFETLVKPSKPIDAFIENLTGITNEMLSLAPSAVDVIPAALSFLGDDVLVGHNVNFDINFLYDCAERYCGKTVRNDFVDTMRISRKVLPELKHHRLKDIAKYYNTEQPIAHRAIAECETTLRCVEHLRKDVIDQYGSEAAFLELCKRSNSAWAHLDRLTTEKTEFDEAHPLYGKHCVFTGVLEQLPRVQAAQMVVDLGGFADNGVTKKTNFLILGNNDYCKSIKDGKSSKHKKAEQYKLEGFDIEIIPESIFYEMISQE